MERPLVVECVRCRVPHPGVSNRVGEYKFRVGLYCARSEADVDSGLLGYAAVWLLYRCTSMHDVISLKTDHLC